MPGTLTAEALALPNVLANFDPAAGLKEPVQPVDLSVALEPVVEASPALTPRLKTIAGGCGPLACAGCPFAQQCRGESAESILKTPTTSESDTKSPEVVAKSPVVEESVAPAAKTPEPAPLKVEKPTPVPVQAAKAPEPKPDVVKPAPIVVPPKTERAPQPAPTPVSQAAERPVRVEAAPISTIAPAPSKVEAVPVKPAPVVEVAPSMEARASTPVASEIITPPQPIAAQEVTTPVATAVERHQPHPQQPVAETSHALDVDVAAIQATREMAATQLLTDSDTRAAVEQPVGTVKRSVVVAETSPEGSSSDTAIMPKTQAARPKARAHTTVASNPAVQANILHETRSEAATKEVASETQATTTAHTTRAASKKLTPESTAHQAAAPIAERLVAKLTSGDVASIGTKIDRLLAKIENRESGTHAAVSANRQERLITATLKDLSELLDIEPQDLERTLQAASEKGEAQIAQLVELLTGLQQLTQGSASRHEIDRLLNQSFLHKALGSPWDGAQQSDDQPHRIWSLGILVMSSLLQRYAHQNSPAAA